MILDTLKNHIYIKYFRYIKELGITAQNRAKKTAGVLLGSFAKVPTPELYSLSPVNTTWKGHFCSESLTPKLRVTRGKWQESKEKANLKTEEKQGVDEGAQLEPTEPGLS